MARTVNQDKNANQKWSAYIKKIYTRPGGRKKRLDERPKVAPPDNSAMLRHHGRLPNERRFRSFTRAANFWGLMTLPVCLFKTRRGHGGDYDRPACTALRIWASAMIWDLFM
jgi:hypothetical protein